ncbi:hypothetical protein [Streptococcus ovis]|uniref:hypothetical protein n=1 Tax=Streptococcus ovis TaxID=82806 RepID=UPI00035C8203|nr:hypothetical protein [Streptococcus ovis]
MFGFLKKKEPKQTPKTEDIPSLTEEKKVELLQKVEVEQQLLANTPDTDVDAVAEAYERLGLLYAELTEVDKAISALEKSLEKKLSMGEGYKKLMSLYNAKRADAAKNRDNDGIDYYMSKMDEMRNIAKKVTLSR